MVEISKYGSGEGLGRVTGRAYSTGNDGVMNASPALFEKLPQLWATVRVCSIEHWADAFV